MLEWTVPLLALSGVSSAGAGGGSVAGLVVFVAIALGVSFVCSILEAVLLSTSPSYLALRIDKGSRAARRMQHHKESANIDRSISAILTLNTIAHTVGAAGAGAEAAAIFGSQWIGVIGAVLTILILVVSEIIPKTLGAVHWKLLMPWSATLISWLVVTLYPIVWACQRLTDMLKPADSEPTVTRAELEILARLGHQEGVIGGQENRVVRNLLRLRKVLVKEILTPRTVVASFQSSLTLEEARAQDRLRFSRIPIYDENKDQIDRFVLRHEILEGVANGESGRTLREISRPLGVVPETLSVAQLLEKFVEEQEHIYLVLDEYGGTEGIVTLEDAIESLLGREITDETDPATDMRELARKRSLPRA